MRTYLDPEGTTWIVYLVTPTGRTSPHLLAPEFQNGWLCFEGVEAKRRLIPIPPDWETCSEHQLERYRASAVPVTRRTVPTSDGRNAPEPGLSETLREIEHFFTRRLPSSLSLALDRFAEQIAQPDAPTALRSAIPDLRLAAQAASNGDFDTAREHYRMAAAFFAEAPVDRARGGVNDPGRIQEKRPGSRPSTPARTPGLFHPLRFPNERDPRRDIHR